jgi:hypothetical protein
MLPPGRRYPNTSADLSNPIRVVHFGYHVQGRQHDPWLKHTWDCFDVHKDVVAAPLDTMNPPKAGHQWPVDLEQYIRSKSKLLMYSGWVPTDYVGWMPGGSCCGGGAVQYVLSHMLSIMPCRLADSR